MTSRIETIGIYFLVAVVVLFAVFPFYYAVVTSFKTGTALFEVTFWPENPSLNNYREVFQTSSFPRNIFNSVLVATVTVGLSLLLGFLASFSLARIPFRGRKTLLLSILSVSMFPQIAILAGLFELVLALDLYNGYGAMILSYLIFTLPFTVWVLTTFMRDLPVEIEEAAIVDGASALTIVFRVFLPMMWPAIVTTTLLAFIAAWNEFLFALTFSASDATRTVPVAISLFSGSTAFESPWGLILAASVIVTFPLVVLVLIFQRKIVSGLTAGGVKG